MNTAHAMKASGSLSRDMEMFNHKLDRLERRMLNSEDSGEIRAIAIDIARTSQELKIFREAMNVISSVQVSS